MKVQVSELCAEIRSAVVSHPHRTGWIVRPHHTKKLVQIGHKEVASHPELETEIETLIDCLDLTSCVTELGYEVEKVSG